MTYEPRCVSKRLTLTYKPRCISKRFTPVQLIVPLSKYDPHTRRPSVQPHVWPAGFSMSGILPAALY